MCRAVWSNGSDHKGLGSEKPYSAGSSEKDGGRHHQTFSSADQGRTGLTTLVVVGCFRRASIFEMEIDKTPSRGLL
jgi:hypothetical protein